MTNAHTYIIQFARSTAAAAPLLLRWRFVAPFAALGLIELVLLAGYIEFTSPGLSRVAVPAIAFFFGEESVHYPQHVLGLPATVDWIRCVAAIMVGFLVYPRAVRLLHAHFHPDVARSSSPDSGSATALLVVTVWAVTGVALQRGVGLLEDVPIVGRFQPIWLAAVLMTRPLLAIVMAQSVWGIAVGGRRGLAALRGGLGVARRYAPITALIAIVALLLLAPLEALLARAGELVDAGHPGILEVVATLAIVWDIPVRLFLVGSAVHVSRVTK